MAAFEKRIGTTGKVTWRARVRRQNGPWLTKTFERKTDAMEWARGVERAIDVDEFVPNAEARRRTLGEVITHYLAVTLPRAKHRKNASEQTRILEWWRSQLGDRQLATLTPAVIAEKRDELAQRTCNGRPIAGATVNRHLAALSGVLSVAVKEYGWLARNPVAGVTRFEDSKSIERFLTNDERNALLAACDASPCVMLGPIVRLALATGARQSELIGLQWANVDLKRRAIRFMDTKNGDARTVPLAQVAVDLLRDYKASRLPVGAVFPIKKSTLNKAWRLARTESGVTQFRFHDLRHTAASYLAMSGASLMDIGAILGHKTLAMVQRYSHLSEQHTMAALDRMAGRFL